METTTIPSSPPPPKSEAVNEILKFLENKICKELNLVFKTSDDELDPEYSDHIHQLFGIFFQLDIPFWGDSKTVSERQDMWVQKTYHDEMMSDKQRVEKMCHLVTWYLGQQYVELVLGGNVKNLGEDYFDSIPDEIVQMILQYLLVSESMNAGDYFTAMLLSKRINTLTLDLGGRQVGTIPSRFAHAQKMAIQFVANLCVLLYETEFSIFTPMMLPSIKDPSTKVKANLQIFVRNKADIDFAKLRTENTEPIFVKNIRCTFNTSFDKLDEIAEFKKDVIKLYKIPPDVSGGTQIGFNFMHVMVRVEKTDDLQEVKIHSVYPDIEPESPDVYKLIKMIYNRFPKAAFATPLPESRTPNSERETTIRIELKHKVATTIDVKKYANWRSVIALARKRTSIAMKRITFDENGDEVVGFTPTGDLIIDSPKELRAALVEAIRGTCGTFAGLRRAIYENYNKALTCPMMTQSFDRMKATYFSDFYGFWGRSGDDARLREKQEKRRIEEEIEAIKRQKAQENESDSEDEEYVPSSEGESTEEGEEGEEEEEEVEEVEEPEKVGKQEEEEVYIASSEEEQSSSEEAAD